LQRIVIIIIDSKSEKAFSGSPSLTWAATMAFQVKIEGRGAREKARIDSGKLQQEAKRRMR
jgi:hypothetical protein